jgi:S-methylmethionine-dependent homocysteine/selenocysteine methylase
MDIGAPLLRDRRFLTFGGVETWLLFVQGFPLRNFSAFEVFEDAAAFDDLERNFLHPTLDAALVYGFGVFVDCFVWRGSPDYLAALGDYDVDAVNRNAVRRMREMVARWRERTEATSEDCPVLIAPEIGPRGDGYGLDAAESVTPEAAAAYHRPQLAALARAGVDVVFALTLTSVAEAIGIVRCARDLDLPLIVSATVETNGHLPDGTSLGAFITEVDRATDGSAVGFMVNCAHPKHLAPILEAEAGPPWLSRFLGLRANASDKSHEELDNSTTLDAGDPADLASRMAALQGAYDLRILGGCCGTDAQHIGHIAEACSTAA